ncbi:hypothetical protein NLJ89_g8291 [Agrocybe chaxingu]|uniref:C2H2-type domain-containing protein n=1 Tax=Agrocybe chaxingu TaxID=84603 RepID=A0A9W8MQX3_9AGAR|nr:hypothetical protein NLJ89_g8291 [Agrocybe chaxingu]
MPGLYIPSMVDDDIFDPSTQHQEPGSDGQWSHGYGTDTRYTQMRDPLAQGYDLASDYAHSPLTPHLSSPSMSPVLPQSPSNHFPNVDGLGLSSPSIAPPQSPYDTCLSVSPHPSWKTEPSPQILPPSRNDFARASTFPNPPSLLPPDGIKRPASRSAPQSPYPRYKDPNMSFVFPPVFPESPSMSKYHTMHSPTSPDTSSSTSEPFRHDDHLRSPSTVVEYAGGPESLPPGSSAAHHTFGLPSDRPVVQAPEYFLRQNPVFLPPDSGPPNAYPPPSSAPLGHGFVFAKDVDCMGMNPPLDISPKPEHVRQSLISQYQHWQDSAKVMKIFSKAAKDKVSTVAGLRASLQRRKSIAKFFCEHCNSSFTRKHNLNNHLKSHYGITDLECRHCGNPFTTIPVKKRHEDTCKGNPDRKPSASTKKPAPPEA